MLQEKHVNRPKQLFTGLTYLYKLQTAPDIKRRSKEEFIDNKWHLPIFLLYLTQSLTCLLTSATHAQDDHQVEFAFMPGDWQSGTRACPDEQSVSRQHIVMQTCVCSHRFVLDPLPQISFRLRRKCFVSCQLSIIAHNSQSGQQYFVLYHQFLRFASFSELPFQSCPIDCGLLQWKH